VGADIRNLIAGCYKELKVLFFLNVHTDPHADSDDQIMNMDLAYSLHFADDYEAVVITVSYLCLLSNMNDDTFVKITKSNVPLSLI